MSYRLPLLALLLAAPASAHFDKPFDMNGGHYDDFGNYHCHQPGCVMTEHRFQVRRTLRGHPRDRAIFFLDEDWPYPLQVNGCRDARNEVLVMTSKVPVTFTNPRECQVSEGLWVDEYTGQEYTNAFEMDVDHIIPLQYADSANGYRWDFQTRASFSNDPANLVPVARDSSRQKRQRSIAEWRPSDEQLLCSYAVQWRDIAGRYRLQLYNRDISRMRTVLRNCGEEEQYKPEN